MVGRDATALGGGALVAEGERVKLEAVRVQKWKNFIDSGWVSIEQAITCLVGKNESGKSAFLEALYRLKPAHRHNSGLDLDMDYPRWRKISDQRSNDLAEVGFVSAMFSLNESDLDEISQAAGVDLPRSTIGVATCSYMGTRSFELEINEKDAVHHLLEDAGTLELVRDGTIDPTLEALISYLKDNERPDMHGVNSKAKKLKAFREDPLSDEVLEALLRLTPTFFYFSDYARLKGNIDLTEVLSKDEEDLEEHELTARGLLELVGVTGPEFSESGIERRLAELEAAAAEITSQVFRYWSQNKQLRVMLVTQEQLVGADTPEAQIVHRFLNIRLLDQRHHVTTNFETRSSGFRWFFSFIVAFHAYQGGDDVVVLLDEPGLSLHGSAQADFLRFVEQQLAPSGQVIYTTHSPFLVEPSQLERVRIVEDRTSDDDPELGATVSDQPFSRDAETLFPLQAALGYELAQDLFNGTAEHLVVEGATDFVFLDTLNSNIKERGRKGLDERISIVPVGGISNVPTFVALLGAHPSVSVLVESSASGMQRLTSFVKQGLLDKTRLVTVGKVIGKNEGDLEDLFRPEEYLRLYNEAFDSNVSEEDLDGLGTIVKQIERSRGGFDHGKPATELLRNKADLKDGLSDATLDRFEALFEAVNRTLPAGPLLT
jgi:predicted ATPase